MILYDPAPGESRHRSNGNTGPAGATSWDDTPVANEQTLDIVGFKAGIDHRVFRVRTGTAGPHAVPGTQEGAYPFTNVTPRGDLLEAHSL